MPVLMHSEYRGPYSFSRRRLRAAAQALVACFAPADCELSLLLVDDAAMGELNRRYRHKDKPTNVLSFPLCEDGEIAPGAMLGDVVISIDTAAAEARSRGIPLGRRLERLLIHGLVHLLGYDHEHSTAEAARMLAREEELEQFLRAQARRTTMTQLAINVDHVATIRQARGITEPDPVLAAGICELAGAAGIVVHLREDRRHIQDRDVRLLRQTVKSKLNLEMGAAEEIIAIALDLGPDMVTLVPEKRQELTTEGGLDVAAQRDRLTEVIARFSAAGIPVSLFIDPEEAQIEAAKEVGATFVEIHTGRYCDAKNEAEREKEFELVATAAEHAFGLGLRVNAGHGLDYRTTARVAALDTIEELSIGHAVMARAMIVGLERAVREMLAIVQRASA